MDTLYSQPAPPIPMRRGGSRSLKDKTGHSSNPLADIRPKRKNASAHPNTAARSKAALRRELEQATRRFLRGGGEVQRVSTGVSAWEPGQRPPAQPLFIKPRSERTPVNEIVATLEARRKAMQRKHKPTARRRSERARKRIIYDDFGEPLRQVWIDD